MFVSIPLLLFIVSRTWHALRARGALAPVVKAEVRPADGIGCTAAAVHANR